MRHFKFVLGACLALGLAACSVHQELPTGTNFYALGQQAYATHDYKGATIYFQKLVDQYPFSPYANQAQLKIGLSQYQMGHYAEAAASLSDFQKMHPMSKHVPLASYYLAMAHFKQIGNPDQDQTNTRQALMEFETIERRYPETGYASLAHQDIEICREMLARHQLLIGDFYYNRANFRAAESRLAQLMQLWPDTPVGDKALYQLGEVLEKEGKKYSAAQAFTAEVLHYPHTRYAREAKSELKKLHEPVGTEEDPLALVLDESGYPINSPDQVPVLQGNSAMASANRSSGAYGLDSLPILKRPSSPAAHAAVPSSIAANSVGTPDGIASASGASAAAMPANAAAAARRKTGPVQLDGVRLSSSNPPLSVIFDLSGPVSYDNKLENGDGYSTFTINLKDTKPATTLGNHLVFDRSIFRDCSIETSQDGTKVTVNTAPVTQFAVVPLDAPPRLLITFVPRRQEGAQADSAGANL